MYLNLLVHHRNIFGSSSKVFGNLRKSSDIFGDFRKFTENVRERSSGLRNNFGKSSKIFGKWSEIFGKSSKTPSWVSLYNKQNNIWTLGDMEFIFWCSHSISHSFAALTRSISMWTLEDKYRLLHRKCDVRIFIHELQDFGKRTSERSERVSFPKSWNEWIKIRTKHSLCCNLFIVYITRIKQTH